MFITNHTLNGIVAQSNSVPAGNMEWTASPAAFVEAKPTATAAKNPNVVSNAVI